MLLPPEIKTNNHSLQHPCAAPIIRFLHARACCCHRKSNSTITVYNTRAPHPSYVSYTHAHAAVTGNKNQQSQSTTPVHHTHHTFLTRTHMLLSQEIKMDKDLKKWSLIRKCPVRCVSSSLECVFYANRVMCKCPVRCVRSFYSVFCTQTESCVSALWGVCVAFRVCFLRKLRHVQVPCEVCE